MAPKVVRAIFTDADGNVVDSDDPAAVAGEIVTEDADGNEHRTYVRMNGSTED